MQAAGSESGRQRQAESGSGCTCFAALLKKKYTNTF
jgi:hypothetical protein